MVRIHPDPPGSGSGAVAQLGEHLLCKQGVVGSIPISSTNQGSEVRHQGSDLGFHRYRLHGQRSAVDSASRVQF